MLSFEVVMCLRNEVSIFTPWREIRCMIPVLALQQCISKTQTFTADMSIIIPFSRYTCGSSISKDCPPPLLPLSVLGLDEQMEQSCYTLESDHDRLDSRHTSVTLSQVKLVASLYQLNRDTQEARTYHCFYNRTR